MQVFEKEKFIGCIIGKTEKSTRLGIKSYIAMIAVKKDYRSKGIGKQLVKLFIDHIKSKNISEVYLETEVTNVAAIKLYESKLEFIF